jgi:hypothetical protein
LKLAMTLASVGAFGRLGKKRAELVKQGKLLGSSPELRTLSDTVRGRLTEAGKAAAARSRRVSGGTAEAAFSVA